MTSLSLDPFGVFDQLVHGLQQALYEGVVQPLLFVFGGMRYAEELFDFCEWVVLGAIEVAVLAVVLGALERRWPAEPVTDREAIRTDVIYTLLHRLGGFALVVFALLTPAFWRR